MSPENLIREIVKKESERYNLINDGFLDDLDKAAQYLLSSLVFEKDKTLFSDKNSFHVWKQEVCTKLYVHYNYHSFFRKKRESTSFKVFLKQLLKNCVSEIQNKCTGLITIDDELELGERSIAYKLSFHLFSVFSFSILSGKNFYTTPIQIEEKCAAFAKENYPLNYNQFLDHLKMKDPEFWNEVIYKISCVVKQKARILGLWQSEILPEIASDVNEFFYKRFEEKGYVLPSSASHFKNSLYKISEYKLKEYFNKSRKSKEINRVDELINDEIYPEEECSETELSILDIDVNNPQELSCAIYVILEKGEGRMWDLLVGNDAENIEIFKMHVLQGMSYEDICKHVYGNLSDKERDKACARFRKRLSRVKDNLKKRIKWLVLYVQGNSDMLHKLEKTNGKKM